MKKLLKILLISLLAISMIMPIMACSNPSDSSKTPGLKYKKNAKTGNYEITSYIQEEGVTVLDLGAKLPAEATSVRIKKDAFSGNSKLTKVIVPETVVLIDAGAFAKMSALEVLEVPFIGKTANADTYYGESKKHEDKATDSARTIAHFFGSSEYDAGIKVDISYNSASSQSCYMPLSLKEIVVKNSAGYRIPMYAFNGAVNLTSIKLEGKITAIGENAFANVKQLAKMEIPESVEKIHNNAFNGCENLSTLTFIGKSKLNTVEKNAFKGTKLNDTALDSVITLSAEQKTEIFGE